jgi:hypothetical protein
MAKYLIVVRNPSSNAGLLTASVDIVDATDNVTTLDNVPDISFGSGTKSAIVQAAIQGYNNQTPKPVQIVATDTVTVFGLPVMGLALNI